MIIRSQDKTIITSDLNLYIVHITIYEPELWCIKSSMGFIGEYSTEEKAIKVLDMIQQEYGRHFYGQGGQMATANYYVPPFAFIPPKVFQMPKDCEV